MNQIKKYDGESVMKRIFLFILLIVFSLIQAVTFDQVKSDDSYLWGDGRAADKETADRVAMKELLSQITLNVESSFINSVVEINGVVNEACKLEVKTYSSARLYHTERLVDEESYAPEVFVLRYIKRSEVDNVFRERESRVNSLIMAGEQAEADKRISEALRNYYWAYALLPTIPEYKKITYWFEGEEKSSYTGLENKLNYLLAGIGFHLEEKQFVEGNNFVDLIVKAEFEGEPVCGLLVSYNDGYGENEPGMWSNGRGSVRLSNTIAETSQKVTLYIDYSYRGHAYDEDVIKAIDGMNYKRLPAAVKELELGESKPVMVDEFKIELKETAGFNAELKGSLTESVMGIAEKVKEKNFGGARQYFTLSGYRDFNKLIDYGKGEILGQTFKLDLVQVNKYYVVRGLPMTFCYAGNKETFSEKVNFLFNQAGKVEKVTFALSDRSISEICDHEGITTADQAEVVNFMELYKTAYCLQELEFLENVFTEDALIIVGTVVEKDPEYNVEGLIEQLGDDKVKYIRLEKDQYMSRLKEQFADKEFINLHFADTSLRCMSSGEERLYGIQIEQYYYSNNYADNGYLFLMFNLSEPEKPRITVRSWQPEKFADGTVVGLEDFRF